MDEVDETCDVADGGVPWLDVEEDGKAETLSLKAEEMLGVGETWDAGIELALGSVPDDECWTSEIGTVVESLVIVAMREAALPAPGELVSVDADDTIDSDNVDAGADEVEDWLVDCVGAVVWLEEGPRDRDELAGIAPEDWPAEVLGAMIAERVCVEPVELRDHDVVLLLPEEASPVLIADDWLPAAPACALPMKPLGAEEGTGLDALGAPINPAFPELEEALVAKLEVVEDDEVSGA
ncbi:MAG: hypothetical protein M1820_009864 [Bogoriella megaspora]|nr:MAG: hypothetical protein M1820_009864 [Bogoriella megaspora]